MEETKHLYNFEVWWKPYILRPNMPDNGYPKAPDTPENPRAGKRLKAAGAPVGIDFTGKTDRYPNTVLSHCLLKIAEHSGSQVQDAVQEDLFQGYFTDGNYPDMEFLMGLAQKHGIDTTEEALKAEIEFVKQEAEENRKQTRGVPFYVMNGKPLFSGAQDPSTFKKAFQQAF